MHKADDRPTVLTGPGRGKTLEVVSVRMFATDNGYYLASGAGLYSTDMVALARERVNGNPCGDPCSEVEHEALRTCDHCRRVCACRLRHRST